MFLTDLALALRAGGCRVIEVPGWQTRSYPGWAPGFQTAPSHVIVHHTASHAVPESDIAYMLRGAPNPTPGRPNLAPIGNLYLDRQGVFHVIAAGKATTNGTGRDTWGGGVPADQMNHHAIAIEAANNGVGEVWATAQCDAYLTGVVALCRHYRIPVNHVRAHAEWSPGRKVDPAGPTPSHPAWGGVDGRRTWDMNAFRRDVTARLGHAAPTSPVTPPVRPHVPFPGVGRRGASPTIVRGWQAVMIAHGHLRDTAGNRDGVWGPGMVTVLSRLQVGWHLPVNGVGNVREWERLNA